MAKNIGSKCKICRQVGEKLFLKGDRCATPKCAMVKKAYPPGMHGKTSSMRRNKSEYGKQLEQKQKIKNIYGILERQFRKHLREAQRQRGIVGENIIVRLELRMDNVVFRMGLASSRAQARQLVNHGHFLVNGKPLNIPSAWLKVGDVISVKPSKQASKYFNEIKAILKKQQNSPQWLAIDSNKLEGKILSRPNKDEVGLEVDLEKVIEFYSR